MDYFSKTVREIKEDAAKTDKFALQNHDYSGEYLRNPLSNDLLSKVLREIPITTSGPEVFITTMHICILKSYKALEETKGQLCSLKLDNFCNKKGAPMRKMETRELPRGGTIAECCSD